MKTLIFILFPIFLSAQVIQDKENSIHCPVCTDNLGLVFSSKGEIELTLAVGGGRQYVLHEGILKPAGFMIKSKGIEVCFDGRKIFFTQNIAYEGDKSYLVSIIGLQKFGI